MKLATWNVNSIKSRLLNVLAWLRDVSPDVLLLQELKCTEEAFPAEAFDDLGYNIALVGQKTYNGVAILAKDPIHVEQRCLPGDPMDEQARYVEAMVGSLRLASLYLPNGNPIDSEKFTYKLSWMDRLMEHVRVLLEQEEAFVLGGDFNVCPTDEDVYDPELFAHDALCHPEVRARFRATCYLGLTDAIRVFHPTERLYTFWDYQGRCWPNDQGLRIDHLLLSPQAADRLTDAGVDKAPRGREKASDHTPVWCTLSEP
ncbi:MAG: exodeoxyribonuclease III [Nitrospirae bacterium]|nr:MAG: exodeoxyribonuclease III [Nitrospirota bacterium]